jgi:hypothetical protein
MARQELLSLTCDLLPAYPTARVFQFFVRQSHVWAFDE